MPSRKMEGDKLRTIDCLRGMLLAERVASKATKEEADKLSKRLRELEGRLAEEIKCRDRAERKLKKAMKKLESTKVLDGNDQMTMPLSSVSSSSSQCLSGSVNADDMLQDVKMRPCSLGSKDLVRDDDDASGSSMGELVRDDNKLALVPVGDQLDLQVREVDDIEDNVQGVLLALRNAKQQLQQKVNPSP